jgi:hypothetical protein
LLPLFLLLAWRLWRGGRLAAYRPRLLATSLLVILGMAPWLFVLWRWGGEVPANLQDITMGARANVGLVPSYLALVWDFLQTGLTGLPAPAALPLHLFALVLVLALLGQMRKRAQRAELVPVAIAFALPIVVAFGVWLYSPLTHPRYLLFLLAPLLLLTARVVVLTRREWESAAARAIPSVPAVLSTFALLLALAASHVGGFQLALFDTEYRRFDMRGLAAAIGARAGPGDVALMPPFDYSLWYYEPGPAEAVNWGYVGPNAEARRPELGQILSGRPGVYFVRYHSLYDYDPTDQVPFLLELNGRLREAFTMDRMDVFDYTLNDDWHLPRLEPADMSCGPLHLKGVAYEAQTRPADALVASLHWALREPAANLVVSMRLHEKGRQEDRLASADVPLLDAAGRPVHDWQPGAEADNFYTLPIPLGAVPGEYALTALVLLEDSTLLCEPLSLGAVRVLPTPGQQEDPHGSWAVTWRSPGRDEVAPGLRLEGYAIDLEGLRPNQPFAVALRWRASSGNLLAYRPRLELRQGDTVLASSDGELFHRYPSDQWQGDELLIERRILSMPSTLAPLQLVIVGEGGLIPLAPVHVDRAALLWGVPRDAKPACAHFAGVGSLVGYEWDPPALTLYWRGDDAVPAEKSYTVFVHLVDSTGALVGQGDGLPADGSRPTDTWLPGEVIADRHQLPLVSEASAFRVGLYDLATGDRVSAADCDGRPLPDNGLALPVS